MLRFLLGLALIALPVLELALLIKTGQSIGFWATLGLVVGAGVAGALVLSRQSMSTMREMMQAASEGRPPVTAAIDGAFLLLAGALLLTPGLLTDVLALLLLIPPIRRGIARWGLNRLIRRSGLDDPGRDEIEAGRSGAERPAGRRSEGPIIDGEFERLGEKTAEPPGKDRRGR